jgi:hypothetical protein
MDCVLIFEIDLHTKGGNTPFAHARVFFISQPSPNHEDVNWFKMVEILTGFMTEFMTQFVPSTGDVELMNGLI